MRKWPHICCCLLICILTVDFFVWYNGELLSDIKQRKLKCVGFHLTNGRLGNQLFHLITGYGIARTLGRVHCLLFEEYLPNVMECLRLFDEVFPLLRHTYVVLENGTNQTRIQSVWSCCAYDDPRRLLNHSAENLLLEFYNGQNPRYFEDFLPEVRNLLQFSEQVQSDGKSVMKELNISEASNMLGIHIRMTDFISLGVATNLEETVRVANDIAKQQGISRFMIFGDDLISMNYLSKMIVEKGKWKENAVIVSKSSEVIDLYLASQVCQSFLISAVTSTFGWWLAFFIKDQNAVYYMPDNRAQRDKVPSKELFLKTWRQYDG